MVVEGPWGLLGLGLKALWFPVFVFLLFIPFFPASRNNLFMFRSFYFCSIAILAAASLPSRPCSVFGISQYQVPPYSLFPCRCIAILIHSSIASPLSAPRSLLSALRSLLLALRSLLSALRSPFLALRSQLLALRSQLSAPLPPVASPTAPPSTDSPNPETPTPQ